MVLSKMSVSQIQLFLEKNGPEIDAEIKQALSLDTRVGVRKLYSRVCRRWALDNQEKVRLEKMKLYEREAWEKGFKLVAGVDEVGRGPLAGPVLAAAVILPQEVSINGINDSKKLSPAKRDILFEEVKKQAVCWSVGIATVAEIDRLNILQASLLAMQRAVYSLNNSPEYVLVDAVQIPEVSLPQLPIIKGDGKSISIAAASIVAKVTRDRMMERFDREYPQYGFAGHKGYGTPGHLKALKVNGISPLHRRSFIKKFIASEVQEELW